MNRSAINLVDVSRTYVTSTEVHALRNLSLDVAAGQVSTVVGPSGSGKTTLLNAIAGLDRPTSGSINVLGSTLHELSDDEVTDWRRRHVAFIFQAKGLVSHLTAYENVELALRLTGRPRAERRAGCEEMLDRVGLTSFMKHRPGELSGGQRQRVAIARALVIDSPLLIADEPTGELDTESSEAMVDLIVERVATTGATALIATHDTAFDRAADRVLRLRDGRLVGDAAEDASDDRPDASESPDDHR